MKGVILAGGDGTRLHPLTKITNKHLLPVYNKPMIHYPINTLREAGIREIMIISGRGHAGHFLELLGSGTEFGCKFTYEIQEKSGGIAQALGIAEKWVDKEDVAVILGDNIFQDPVRSHIEAFERDKDILSIGAKIFLKSVPNANRFGVAELQGDRIVGIEEKPEKPKSNYAVTGLYLYNSEVFEYINWYLKPSARGELEITDVNNVYIGIGEMSYSILKGYWSDAGTFDSLLHAGLLVKNNWNGI